MFFTAETFGLILFVKNLFQKYENFPQSKLYLSKRMGNDGFIHFILFLFFRYKFVSSFFGCFTLKIYE